jgi:hypothetical protein
LNLFKDVTCLIWPLFLCPKGEKLKKKRGITTYGVKKFQIFAWDREKYVAGLYRLMGFRPS